MINYICFAGDLEYERMIEIYDNRKILEQRFLDDIDIQVKEVPSDTEDG